VTSNTLPLVTIAIPLYNEEKFILETVYSAINQTYKNIEIIISDNCSTDCSSEKIIEVVQKNTNVQLIKHPVNIGATANFNFLKNEAKGEYFMWLGAHDVISKNYIENSIKVLDQNLGIVMAFHNAVFFSDTLNLDNLQGDASSYIDTMSYKKVRGRMYEVVSKLSYCTAIHGVFRTKVLRNNPLQEGVMGPDHLVLFETAAYGHIKNIQKIGYFRRTLHVNENQETKMKRYREYKIVENIKSNPFNTLAEKHLTCLLRSEKLNFLDKLKLIRHIIALFSKHHKVSRILMIKQIFESFRFINKGILPDK